MLKARDVIQEQENQRERRMSAMRPVLAQIYAQIKKQAIHASDAPYLVFEIPKFVFGYPLFKLAEARDYLLETLTQSGFSVWPVNNDYLLIMWAKQQMNRAPFEAFVVDNPQLFEVLSTPAVMEAAETPAAALGALNALRGNVEGALNAVRTTLRTSQPPLDKDVVVRMERLLQDSLT